MNKKLFLNTKRVTGTNEKGEYDFLSFYTYDKQNKAYTVKFTKEAFEKLPQLEQDKCYDLVFAQKQLNLDTKTEFPTIWVTDFISCKIHEFYDLFEDELF